MKFRKIVALAAALTQLCVFIPSIQAASVSEDTVVYSYDYTQYADANAVKAKGLTIQTTNSWGTPVNNIVVGDKTKVWWIGSAKSGYSSLTDISKVNIVSDNADAAAASENDVILFDIDYGARMSQKGSNEYAQLRFVGTNSDNTEAALATFEMNIPTNKYDGTAYFVGRESTTVPYVGVLSSATGQPGQRTNLRIAFDMKNKTYSAWYIKRAEHGATSASTDAPALLLHDVPMLCDETDDAKYPNHMYYTIKNNAGSALLAPVSMTTTILSDATVVATAKDGLTISATASDDISLPSRYLGADLVWSSDNDKVIANDGTVTRPAIGADDAVVTLTATIARGEHTDTKTFEVTVLAETFVPEVSDNGIWEIDNMQYATTADIPKDSTTEKHYFASANLSQFAEKEDVDTSNAELNGYAYAEDNSIKIVRASTVGTTGTQDTTFTKYLSSTPQHVNEDLVLEFEFERIGSPDVYIAVQALSSWKGPATVNNTKSNTLNTYGVASKAGKKTNKVTMVFNGGKKTFDTYFNGVLYKSGQAYRYTDDGTIDISRIGFTIKGATAVGDGIKLNYVRFMDKAVYGNWSFENESEITIPETVDAYTTSISLPQTGANNNKITWTSSDESVITPAGAVTHYAEEKQVTMSAVYTNIVTGETKAAGEYVVTVEKTGELTAEVAQMEDIAPLAEATVTVNAANATAASTNVDIYYAFYNEDGTLNSVIFDSNVAVPVGKNTIEKPITAPETADELKVFVWDSVMKTYAKGGCNIVAVTD